MKVFQHETRLRTASGLTVNDITEDVQNCGAGERGRRRNRLHLLPAHDLLRARERDGDGVPRGLLRPAPPELVPSESYYAHDDWDRRTENICPEDMDQGNGHSHCMAMLLGTAGESVPVREGELQLGTWQRVLFIELDRERDRRWLVRVVGA